MNIVCKFEKFGNKIKMTLPVKNVYCTAMKKCLPKTLVSIKTDLMFKQYLGDVDKVFKTRKVVYKKVNLNQIYDSCDIFISY